MNQMLMKARLPIHPFLFIWWSDLILRQSRLRSRRATSFRLRHQQTHLEPTRRLFRTRYQHRPGRLHLETKEPPSRPILGSLALDIQEPEFHLIYNNCWQKTRLERNSRRSFELQMVLYSGVQDLVVKEQSTLSPC